jgi:hypothetical protein
MVRSQADPLEARMFVRLTPGSLTVGLADWPPHGGVTDRSLELGPNIEQKAGLRKAACDVLDLIYPTLWGAAR